MQPVLERHVFRVAPEQGHGSVGVDVEKAVCKQPVLTGIIPTEGSRVRRRRCADIGDAAVFYADEAVLFYLEILIYIGNIAEKHVNTSCFLKYTLFSSLWQQRARGRDCSSGGE